MPPSAPCCSAAARRVWAHNAIAAVSSLGHRPLCVVSDSCISATTHFLTVIYAAPNEWILSADVEELERKLSGEQESSVDGFGRTHANFVLERLVALLPECPHCLVFRVREAHQHLRLIERLNEPLVLASLSLPQTSLGFCGSELIWESTEWRQRKRGFDLVSLGRDAVALRLLLRQGAGALGLMHREPHNVVSSLSSSTWCRSVIGLSLVQRLTAQMGDLEAMQSIGGDGDAAMLDLEALLALCHSNDSDTDLWERLCEVYRSVDASLSMTIAAAKLTVASPCQKGAMSEDGPREMLQVSGARAATLGQAGGEEQDGEGRGDLVDGACQGLEQPHPATSAADGAEGKACRSVGAGSSAKQSRSRRRRGAAATSKSQDSGRDTSQALLAWRAAAESVLGELRLGCQADSAASVVTGHGAASDTPGQAARYSSASEFSQWLATLGISMDPRQIVCCFRTGSHMYGTHIAGSDDDYTIVWALPRREVLSLYPPRTPTVTTTAVNAVSEEGQSKVEYTMIEAGEFACKLLRGEIGAVELLYANACIWAGPAWLVLLRVRDQFLTRRTLDQCLGFLRTHLQRLKRPGSERGQRKVLYHIERMLLTVRRLRLGLPPQVFLSVEDQDRIRGLRLADTDLGELIRHAEMAVEECLRTDDPSARTDVNSIANPSRISGEFPGASAAVVTWLRHIRQQ